MCGCWICHAIQLITIKRFTKFQNPKTSSCWEIFDRKKVYSCKILNEPVRLMKWGTFIRLKSYWSGRAKIQQISPHTLSAPNIGQPMIRLCLCTCWVDLSTRFSLFVMKCIKIINDTKFMLVSFDINLMYTLINARCTRAEKYSNSNATNFR